MKMGVEMHMRWRQSLICSRRVQYHTDGDTCEASKKRVKEIKEGGQKITRRQESQSMTTGQFMRKRHATDVILSFLDHVIQRRALLQKMDGIIMAARAREMERQQAIEKVQAGVRGRAGRRKSVAVKTFLEQQREEERRRLEEEAERLRLQATVKMQAALRGGAGRGGRALG